MPENMNINISSGEEREQISKDFINLMIGDVTKHRVPAFEEALEKEIDTVLDVASKSAAVHDAYSNSLTATGTDDKVKSFSKYGFDNSTLNWPLWLALYNDSWVFRRAIDKPAQDCVNAGFTIHGDKDYSPIYKAFNRYSFDVTQILRWGALFGGSIGVMLFDGIPDEEMANPINPRRIRKRKMRLYVTDRWYGVQESSETVTNMKDMDFGKPVYYTVCFADGHSVKVHHSYVLRYEHRTAPRLIKCGQLQGWGYAEGSHILNELSRDDQLKSAITSLVNKSLIEVIKMSGMRGVFMGADKGNEEQLRKRLEMVNWGRNFNSLTFLDKDDEYIQHELSNITGLSNLLETNMWLVAAALEMQGVLFGDLKGGLSQESDAMRRYAKTIESRCNAYYRPVLQKLLTILFIMYGIDETPDFDFNSLVADEINNDKTAAINSFAQMLQTLTSQGIISKYQAALSLQNFVNNKAVTLDFTDEFLNKLRFETEAEILAAYKLVGKSAPPNILEEQFPQEDNPFTGKLAYLSSVETENPSTQKAEELINETDQGE